MCGVPVPFILIFYLSPNVAPKRPGQSRSHSISRIPLQISLAIFFVFDVPPKLRVVQMGNKKRTEWQTWNFTNMINCFCCYVSKLEGEIAKKVLLSVIWNPMLIEINLSQIRTLYTKCKKVSVCLYLIFCVLTSMSLQTTLSELVQDYTISFPGVV